MKSFHARLDIVTRDLDRYEASEHKFAGPTRQYSAEWIARLQCRNDILDKKCDIVGAKLVEERESGDEDKERLELMEGKVHKLRVTQGKDGDEIDRLKKVVVDMAKELGIQDVALAKSKRKLNAANELLKVRDVVIADLRDRQEEILEEDAECFEELEAANKRQKEMLERQTKLLEEGKLTMLRLDQMEAQQSNIMFHLDNGRTTKDIKVIISRALDTH